ncbi:MAG: hypothetical protein R3192_04490 [Woeseiaceae bacterium]|nr:hypothetical protein [Woeseiaceae bacterium]
MTLDRDRIFQAFKYAVYLLLTLNIFFFFAEEWAASPHRFADGPALGDIIEGYAATIDTAAWVVLLYMFELETYVLQDRHMSRRVIWSLHGLRTLCYVFIVYAAYGYLVKLIYLYGAAPLPGVSDLCTLVDGRWAYAVDFDEYEVLTTANCGLYSQASSFLQYPGVQAVVDEAGLLDIIRLAWTDVINATVWLLVVLILEIDVRLQERQILEGLVLRVSNLAKYLLYSILFLAAAYWGFKGDFVDFWDAFLWLVAFIFIELNVLEWRQESAAERIPAATATP